MLPCWWREVLAVEYSVVRSVGAHTTKCPCMLVDRKSSLFLYNNDYFVLASY